MNYFIYTSHQYVNNLTKSSLVRVATIKQENRPGRNPGTSTKVIIGMLNESQKRTKRAPLTDALISKQPTKVGKKNTHNI